MKARGVPSGYVEGLNDARTPLAGVFSILLGEERLCHEMRGKEHVLKSVSSKNDLLISGKLVDAVEDLIPGVLRHQADECIQADDGLLIEMIENAGRESIAMNTLPL